MINWFQHKYPYTNFHELNLDWLIQHFQDFIDEINSLEEWKTTHEAEYQELLSLYNELKEDYDNLNSGNWTQEFQQKMIAWWQANAVDLVGELVKFVFFGLTLDGHFVAYIPENWKDIEFDTIMTPGDDYGKLTLSY